MARWTTDDIPDQTGRTVLVTGANSGLGLRTSEALAAKGAEVLLACRDKGRAAKALESVKAVASGAAPRIVTLDLADLASVSRAAEEVTGSVDRLDFLVNNAGVMAIPHRTTADGFEMQFGTNHLGPFALTMQLLPALSRSATPRVVTVSSLMHWPGRMLWDDLNAEKRYSRWGAYCQSKLANLLFTSELDRRAKHAGAPLIAAAAHPGFADTNLQYVGPQMSGSRMMTSLTSVQNRLFAQSDAMGALPQLRAATAPDVAGDDFYGPGPLPGPLAFRGYPVRVSRSPAAKRAGDAARLWQESERLTGVAWDMR